MPRLRRQLPWMIAVLACLAAIATRQLLIQPVDIAHRCDAPTLTLFTNGPWWCSVRSAVVMTYAWNGLTDAAIALSVIALAWQGKARTVLATATLVVGLFAIVWYTYEAGAVAITIGALVLARCQERRPDPLTPRPTGR